MKCRWCCVWLIQQCTRPLFVFAQIFAYIVNWYVLLVSKIRHVCRIENKKVRLSITITNFGVINLKRLDHNKIGIIWRNRGQPNKKKKKKTNFQVSCNLKVPHPFLWYLVIKAAFQIAMEIILITKSSIQKRVHQKDYCTKF